MKKALKLSIMLLIMICIICTMGNVYAELNCSANIETTVTELNKNDEFSVDINVSDIQSELGVISLGATLEYDNDSLEIIKIEGKNGWETPTDGTSYNTNNGKIAITRSGFGKSDETVFTITFRVKEESKQNLIIILRNITIADGTKPVKFNEIHKNITIIDGTPNDIPTVEQKTEQTTNKITIDKNLEKNKNNTHTIIVIICICLIIFIIAIFIRKNIILRKKRKYTKKGKRMKK